MIYSMQVIKSCNVNPVNIRTFCDNLGLVLVYTLICLIPFHFYLHDKIVFYREFIAFIYLLLCIERACHIGKRYINDFFDIKNELFILLIFPIFLAIAAIIIPSKPIYNIDITHTSLHLSYINKTLYVLRNATLYLPMVIYFYLRGLSNKEIHSIALVSVLVAPISVISFLYFHHIATITTLQVLGTLYGAALQYNSYVPHLSFAFLSAIFLVNTSESHFAVKCISFCVSVILMVYFILSTSRQTILFGLLCGFLYLIKNYELNIVKRILLAFLFFFMVFFLYKWVLSGFSLQYKFLVDLFHAYNNQPYNQLYSNKVSRWNIMLDGLSILQPHEWLTGVGVTSVISSGPHCDYIRWLQRVGIFGMALGFYPFIGALFKISKVEHLCAPMKLFMFLAVFFILYHSVFGYPREDSYQAVYCFLGLAMWFGFSSKYRYEERC